MAFRKSVLGNGVALVTDSMPQVRSIALGLWYRIGSRDEQPPQAGLAHFLEHMMFKGTPQRTAVQISEAFDAMGAESNAFTGKENTCYYAHFVDDKLPQVVPLLADMVLNSSFREVDLEPEREVVLEEIARSEDEPDDHVFEMFNAAMLPTHPLGRPVLGTAKTVSSFGQGECRAFRDGLYHAGNLVVSAAGNVDHEELAVLLERELGGINRGERLVRTRQDEQQRERFACQQRDTEQAYLVYGVPWYAAGDPRRFAGSLLCAILGGSASSRLFQEVREKNGLAYSVGAEASVYSDAGQFYVYCATRPDKLAKTAAIIRRELQRAACDAPSREELDRACEVMCSQLLMGLESTSERMIRLGRRESMGLAQQDASQMVECYRAVTPAAVREVAEAYLSQDPTAAVIAPFAQEEAHHLVFG